jgi:aspartyl-tRNA(Asn)/glutamyl-tRNA(Gln) amidotransferase subunit C
LKRLLNRSDDPMRPTHDRPTHDRPTHDRLTQARLTHDDVRHVAELAKLRLTEAEIEQYTEQLSAILDYAERLQSVDTSHVPPTPYVLPLNSVMRDDTPEPCLPNEVALANAPDQEDGFFRVRAVFEGAAFEGTDFEE